MVDRALPHEIATLVSQLDQTWREWLFGDLESGQALVNVLAQETQLFDHLRQADRETREQVLFAKSKVSPFLHAMVASIRDLRDSGLNESNPFVRGREFYKHLPDSCLIWDAAKGMLTVPRPGSIAPEP